MQNRDCLRNDSKVLFLMMTSFYTTSLNNLPVDVLIVMFSYLDTQAILQMEQTCTNQRKISHRMNKWKTLDFTARYFTRDSSTMNDISLYIESCRLELVSTVRIRIPKKTYDTNQFFQSLTTNSFYSNITTLDMTGVKVTEDSFCDFISSKCCLLKILHAGTCFSNPSLLQDKYSMHGLGWLSTEAISSTCSGLVVLDIAGWGITDYGLKTLLESMPLLTVLGLQHCDKLTPSGMRASITSSSLIVLDVSGIVPWEMFIPPPSLEILFASGGPVNVRCVRRLLKSNRSLSICAAFSGNLSPDLVSNNRFICSPSEIDVIFCKKFLYRSTTTANSCW